MSDVRKELLEWSETLTTFHLPRWEELPDFDLYMDQVITLMQGYLAALFNEKENVMTSAMINNYAKLKLIPKTEKKRYQRTHMAYLIAITILKQVLTITEVKEGIEYQSNINGLKEAYNLFCEELEADLEAVIKQLLHGESMLQLNGMTLENTALKMASISFCCKLVAEKIVHLQKMQEKQPTEE